MNRITLYAEDETYDVMDRYFREFRLDRLRETLWHFNLPGVTGTIRDLPIGRGAAVSLVDITTERPFQFRAAACNDETIVKLGVVVSGSVGYEVAGARRRYDGFADQCSIGSFRGPVTATATLPAHVHVRSAQLILSPDALRTLFRRAGINSPPTIDDLVRRSPVWKCASVVSHAVESMARELLAHLGDASRHGEARWTALGEHLAHHFADPRRSNRTMVAPDDIERVRRARELLLGRMDSPPKGPVLARLVGLNEFKLKIGYRQAFGVTMGEDLREARLVRAHALLSKGGRTVTDAALTVGYGNVGDFGIAFRRRFGVSPREVRDGVARRMHRDQG